MQDVPAAQLLLVLIPGAAMCSLSAAQAKVLLARVPPGDVVGETRRRVAAELVADQERIYARNKPLKRGLEDWLNAAGTSLVDLSHHVELTHSPHTEVFEACPWNSVSQTARLLRIAYAVTERRILTARRWASAERVHSSCRLHPARDAF